MRRAQSGHSDVSEVEPDGLGKLNLDISFVHLRGKMDAGGLFFFSVAAASLL